MRASLLTARFKLFETSSFYRPPVLGIAILTLPTVNKTEGIASCTSKEILGSLRTHRSITLNIEKYQGACYKMCYQNVKAIKCNCIRKQKTSASWEVPKTKLEISLMINGKSKRFN